MGRTKIWATEEVVFPTLMSLLGLRVVKSPFNYDYVKYRRKYTLKNLQIAMKQKDIFWIHPVDRNYNNELRGSIRARFGEYTVVKTSEP